MSNATTYSLTEEDLEDRTRTGIDMSSDGVTVTASRTQSRGTKNRGRVATAMHNLRKKCEQLKEYASYKKTDLPEEVFDIFVQVSELATQVGGTSQYDEYLRITTSVFADQIPGEGDTVADFFLGCGNAHHRSGMRIGCEQRCAGNLPRDGYTAEDFCDTHVGIYSSGSLSITYSPVDKSDTIRLYHSQRDFSLSTAEIAKLKKLGVNNVVLSYTGGSVNVTSRVTLMSLSRVSVVKGQPKTRSQASSCSRKDRDGDGGIGTAGWVIGAVIFFILLILIIWLVVYIFRAEPVTYENSCAGQSPYEQPDGTY